MSVRALMSKGVAENSRSGFSEKMGGEVEDKEEENNEKEEGGKTSGKGGGVYDGNICLFSLLLSKEHQEYQEQGRIHDIRCVPVLHYAIFSDFYKSITDQRMDQQTDGWTNGWMDGRTDGPMDGPMDGPTDGWTDGHTLL